MSYPHIFERVYLSPLCVTPARFASMHAFLLPRIDGTSALEMPQARPAADANGQPNAPRDNRSPVNAKRAQKCGPQMRYDWNAERWVIADPRFFYEPVPGVAVVPIYGALAKNLSAWEEECGGGTDIGAIAEAFDQASKDTTIHTIVLDIGSPGGQSTGIPELGDSIAAAVAASTKRVISFTDDIAASAAYWLGSQADEFYATGSASVGSIGVYLAWLDPSVRMSMEGLKLQFFHRGKHKGIGLPGRELSEEDELLLQAQVDAVYNEFTAAVSHARPQVPATAMEGQCFSGPSMVDNGLVDGLVSGWNEMLELAQT